MDIISAISNPKIQYIKKLYDKSFAKKEGVYIVEGYFSIKDAPPTVCIKNIYVSQKAIQNNDISSLVKRINTNTVVVTDKVMDSIADTTNPSGIIAVVERKKNNKLSGNALVLDGIRDPGNMGTIIRSAIACGYNDIIVVDSVDPYNSKVVRSTMSGIFRVNIIESTRLEIGYLLHGYEVFALDMYGQSIFEYVKEKKKTKHAIVVGSETHGVSSELRKIATRMISLPMKEGIESLNAAVSTGIVMYLMEFLNN